MVNILMSMNFIFLLFLISNENTNCYKNSLRSNYNNNFLQTINGFELGNKLISKNDTANELINSFYNEKLNLNFNNNLKLRNIFKKNLDEVLNLRQTLKFEYLNISTSELNQLSFLETTSNAQESEFFTFITQPFTWTNVSVAGKIPSPRKDYSSILADSYLIIFGGCTQDNDFYSDLLFYDILGQTWLEIKQKGKVPSARCGHTAILHGSVMWMFGGYSREGYLNDLYALDLETRVWKQHYFNGDYPLSRSNHGAVVDDSAKIYIFGGYSERGYLNDLFYIDTINEKFEKVTFSSNPPTPREDFAMILISKRIFIFGGFQEGGVLNDFFTIDLITNIWDVLKPEGPTPSPRQGMGVERFGKKILISGGCDYRKHECYSDSYILDTETMWWTKIENDYIPIKKGGFRLNFFRGNVFAFGGCYLSKNCTNDILSLNVDELCPNECTGNGKCQEFLGCICKTGFVSNDCSINIKCKNDCSKNGICHNNGKCGCFPGWLGSSCESQINCPRNCTSFDNGICQTDGKCLCKEGFEGTDCSNYMIIGKNNDMFGNENFDYLANLNLNEINSRVIQSGQKNLGRKNYTTADLTNLKTDFKQEESSSKRVSENKKINICSNHGNNSRSSDCSEEFIKIDSYVKESKSKSEEMPNRSLKVYNNNNSTSLLKESIITLSRKNNEKIKKTDKPRHSNKVKPDDDTDDDDDSDDPKTIKNKDPKNDKNSQDDKVTKVEKNTKEEKNSDDNKKSNDDKDDKDDKVDEDDKPKYYIINGNKYFPTTDCTDNCNKKGRCFNSTCMCQQGYTNEDCSMTIKDYKEQGILFDDIFILIIVIFVLGMILKLIITIVEKSSKKYDDHLNLE